MAILTDEIDHGESVRSGRDSQGYCILMDMDGVNRTIEIEDAEALGKSLLAAVARLKPVNMTISRHFFSKEQVECLLTQAWRAGFLSTGEGRNAECFTPDEAGWDELCDEEVDKLMAGTLEPQPSVVAHFSLG